MADPAFIAERRGSLAGLVATHAHEDHIGAIPYLWPRLRCPVYATPFTAAVLRLKLAEAGLENEVPIIEVPLSGKFTVGPFELELLTLTHSIPEPNAVILRTKLGAVLHTGDWKFDPDPTLGAPYDMAALERLGDSGVLAMICDSTNAMRPGDVGIGSQGARRARRSRRALPKPRRHRLLCLERGAPAIGGGGGGGARPARGARRPLALAHRARGARDRVPRGCASFPHRGGSSLSAARKGAAALHRKPGRAALGARRASPRTSMRTSCSSRATP